MKSLVIRILCLSALVTTLIFSSGSYPVMAGRPQVTATPPDAELNPSEVTLASDNVRQVYIVKFRDAPLATYTGTVRGLAATNSSATGDAKLDIDAPESQAYLQYLDKCHEEFRLQAQKVVGRSLSFLHTYDIVFGGAAMSLTPLEAAKIEQLPDVVSIKPDFTRETQTDAGPVWIGADDMWTAGYKGEGMLVGVVDTGVNPLNPSFADIGDDGYNHPNTGTRFGVCDPLNADYDASFPCNDKLIGAYGMTIASDPIDADGHGSHTASTAAGSVVNDAEISAPTVTITRPISGVAPHAHLITYRACDGRSCDGSALIASINQAVADGVDVINYSIGSDSPLDPWLTDDSLAFKDARAAGVFVATSAGNAGPGFGTVGSPANAPWLTSVGNSSHDRTFVNSLINMSGGTAPLADMTGKSITAGYGPVSIVYAGDYGNALCGLGEQLSYTSPWPPGTFSGEIVVCDRGTYGRIEKGVNLAYSGAGGYILVNDAGSGDSLVADAHVLPAVHLTYTQGVQLKAWLANGTGHSAQIDETSMILDSSLGDIMASSSSRGKNVAVPGVIKPDVTAPGTDILAAYGTGGAVEWGIIGGTSMASPHVAGAGALLMQMHPDWTPAEVQSALMLTGETQMLKEDGSTATDPFDMGGGRVSIGAAGNAGFVMDISIADYNAANPSSGGDPAALNMASLGHDACANTCTWTRQITSAVGESVAWTAASSDPVFSVEPASFTLPAAASQVITITADVSSLPSQAWYFGAVDFDTSTAGISDAHMSVAVFPTSAVLPSEIRVLAGRDAGSRLAENLELNAGSLNTQAVGLEPTITEIYQEEDPTPVWPTAPNGMYDDLSQVFYTTIQVPPQALYLAVELLETTSPDLDLAVGYDANNDGLPAESEELGTSGSMGALESVFFTASELENAVGALSATAYATGGQYWVLVMNFEASAPGAADYFKLATAAISTTDTATDVWMDTPASSVLGTPFDARLYYDLPDFDAWYGIVQFYDDTDYQSSVPVQIVRRENDVIKDLLNVEYGSNEITATFAITVNANTSGETWSYAITDTLPTGLTFVPGSASNGAVINGNTLTWDVDMSGARSYAMSTSKTDPLCAMPLATGNAYIDLEDYGFITTDLSGNASAWTLNVGTPINFYGVNHGGSLTFTDDGFVFFDQTPAFTLGTSHTTLPAATAPNDLLAMLWMDLELIYDAGSNAGATLDVVLQDVDANPIAKILEFDDVIKRGDPGSHLDFETVVYYQPNDAVGEYEIIFAYDNIVGDFTNSTVGVENPAGTEATLYGYNDVDIENDMAICFDWTYPQPQSITYQVIASTPNIYTTTMTTMVSDPGADLVTEVYILSLVSDNDLIINEISTKSTEWVELYNPNPVGADLTGHYLSDSPCGSLVTYNTFNNIVVAPHGYLLVNSEDAGDNFDLDDNGDTLYFCSPTHQETDRVAYGNAGGAPLAHVSGSGIINSTARTPNGQDTDDDAADWNVDTTPTPGTENDAPGVKLGSGLIINEIRNNSAFELYNPTNTPILLSDYIISDGDMAPEYLPVSPGTVIGVRAVASIAFTRPSFEITEDDVLYLFNANLERVDQLSFHGLSPSISYSVQRVPDGAGPHDGYDWLSSGGGVTLFDFPDTLNDYNLITSIRNVVTAPAFAIPGDIVTYTVTLNNLYNETLSPISMEDVLPDGLTFETWVTTPYTDTQVTDNSISWTGDMVKNSAIVWTFRARVGAKDGPITMVNPAELTYYGYSATANASFLLGDSIWMPVLLRNGFTE